MLERQVADPDRADADALEAGDAQRDQFSHAPNLPLASFAENETELVVVEPFDYRRFQLPRIETEAVVQEGEAFGVDEDPAACVVGVRVTTRTEATLGHQLGDPYAVRCRDNRASRRMRGLSSDLSDERG